MAKTKWLSESEVLDRLPGGLGVITLREIPIDVLRSTQRWQKVVCPHCHQPRLEKLRFYLAASVRWLLKALDKEPWTVKTAGVTVRKGSRHQARDKKLATAYLRSWKRCGVPPKKPWRRHCWMCSRQCQVLARPNGERHHAGLCPGCLKRHNERRSEERLSRRDVAGEAEDLLRELVVAEQEEILGSVEFETQEKLLGAMPPSPTHDALRRVREMRERSAAPSSVEPTEEKS